MDVVRSQRRGRDALVTYQCGNRDCPARKTGPPNRREVVQKGGS
jgi:hypothetical protein